MTLRRVAMAVLAATLAGCAQRTPAPVISVVEAPPPPLYAPMPRYASPGMTIPAVLPDGRYPTPSDGVSAAGAVWHLRAALNVAALSCKSADGQAIVDDYNRLLVARRAELAAAQATLAAEYHARAGDFDAAMTRLYNFYAQFPARDGFCEAAAQTLTALAAAPATALSGTAPAELATLDRPFTDFYRAYDAWRAHVPLAAPETSIALSAPVPVGATPGFHRIELGPTSVVAP